IYPATPLQSGLLFNTFRDSSTYVNQMKWTVQYELDVGKLEHAMEKVCEAFDIFRTRFVSTSKGIHMILQRKVTPEIHLIEDYAEYCMKDYARGFSDNDSMWFRLAIAYPAGGISKLVFTLHHVLYDGWCFNRIINAIFTAYEGETIPKSVPFRKAVDYIYSTDNVSSLEFWKKYLDSVDPDTGFNQKLSQEVNSKPLKFQSNADLSTLKHLSTVSKYTSATIAKAAWALTLKVYQQREKEESYQWKELKGVNDLIPSIVGMMINTLPVVVNCESNLNLMEFLSSIQDDFAGMLTYSHESLVEIQNAIGVPGGGSLFSTSFVFENLPEMDQHSHLEGNSFSLISFEESGNASNQNFNDYDIQVILEPVDGKLNLLFEYNSGKLSENFIEAISSHFDYLLQKIVDNLRSNPTILISNIVSLPQQQEERLIKLGTGPTYTVPFELIHLPFEQAAGSDPDLVAVEHGDLSVTYGELNRKAEGVAAALIDRG
ncbi:hypothetical protein HDV06_003672, partial [Boothiomyces sp. JEL0866]